MVNVAIIAAHPDDEVLGCGGVISRHTTAGDRVDILFLADGVSSRRDGKSDLVLERQKCAKNAADILGASPPMFLEFPDNQMDTIPFLEIVQKLESFLDLVEPNIIYTHHLEDLNIDHQITHRAVLTACRPLPDQCVREIYAFEVLSSTEWSVGRNKKNFSPTYHKEISSHIDVKLEALACYAEELKPFPHPRSNEAVLAQARLRGSEAGLLAAEGFEVIRRIER